MIKILRTGFLALPFALSLAHAGEMEDLKLCGDAGFLQAGAATRTITPATDGKPWNGLYFAGYQRIENPKKNWYKWLVRGVRRDPKIYNHPDGVRDDLHVRALVLKGGGAKIGLVTVDAVGLLYPEAEEIRRRVADLGFDVVVVQATHNHEGPDTMGLWGPVKTPPAPLIPLWVLAGANALQADDGKQPQFMERIRSQAADALRAADAGARPASLEFAEAPVPPIEGKPVLHDNRYPVVYDGSVHALRAVDASGNAIATLVNFGVHPEILGNHITRMSADLSGQIAGDVERASGGVALHSNGAIGGIIGPNDLWGEDKKDPSHDDQLREKGLAAIGGLVAQTAVRSLAQAAPARISRVGVLKRRFFIPMDNRLLDMAAKKGLFSRPRFTDGREDAGGQDLETEIDLIVFHGPAGEPLAEVFSIPGELTPEIYLGGYLPADQAVNPSAPAVPVLKDHLRAPHQYLLGLGNDELGYILPLNDFLFPHGIHPAFPSKDRFGRPHYEETVSASSQMSQLVALNLIGMLEEYYDGRTELTVAEAARRSRLASVEALKDQNGAAPALVQLYLHLPVDEATPKAKDALLKLSPDVSLPAMTKAHPTDPAQRRLYHELTVRLAGL